MKNNILEIIKSNYSFDEEKGITLLREGTDNAVYSFFDSEGKRNIARVGKRKTSESIDFEIKLLNVLVEKGVKVAPVIKTIEGKDFVDKNGNAVACFEFIEGETTTIDDKISEKTDLIIQAGKALGEFHKATLNVSIPSEKRRTIFSEMDRVLDKPEKIKEMFEGGEEFIDDVKKSLDVAKLKTPDWGIIHNDYNASNVLFKDSKVSAILDFDWACQGPLLMDVGYGAMAWSTPDKITEPNIEAFEGFINGYNSTGPIKINKDKDFYFWTAYSCLYLAANVLCDAFFDNRYNLKSVNQVWMCRRFKYFSSL